MSRYPKGCTDRAGLREEIRGRFLEQGRQQGEETGRSLKCRRGAHAPAGCQNSGTSCLCECHDEDAS